MPIKVVDVAYFAQEDKAHLDKCSKDGNFTTNSLLFQPTVHSMLVKEGVVKTTYGNCGASTAEK